MKRKIIRIENRTVIVPGDVKMSICEIADLFAVFYQAVKRHIRAIEKSSIAGGDYSMCCTSEGKNVYPEYYGLEMIVAVAFRVQNGNTILFRKWVMKRIVSQDITATLILPFQKAWLN